MAAPTLSITNTKTIILPATAATVVFDAQRILPNNPFLITSTASQEGKQDIHSGKSDQNVNYPDLLESPINSIFSLLCQCVSYDELRISNYVECFWQFGIQNISVAVLIDISAGLQGY